MSKEINLPSSETENEKEYLEVQVIPSQNLDDKELQYKINKAWNEVLPEISNAVEKVPKDIVRNLRSKLNKPLIENELKKEKIDSLREKRKLEKAIIEFKKVDLELLLMEQQFLHNDQDQLLKILKISEELGINIRSFLDEEEIVQILLERIPLKSRSNR